MPHHYYYGNGGTHWSLWIVMIVALLVFLGLLASVVVNITRQKEAQRSEVSQPLPGTNGLDPLRILNERLARGEIEVGEYTRRRDLLQEGSSAKGSG
jgi:putative membrane protein